MSALFSATRVRGVSLLELLLVFIILAIILLAALPRIQLYERSKDLAVVQQNVNLLFQASQTYYHLCCSASQGVKSNAQCTPCGNNQFCISTSALSQANLMPKLMVSKLAKPEAYEVAAVYKGVTESTKKPIYQLQVMANLAVSRNAILWFFRTLQANNIQNTTLIWQKFPNYNAQPVSNNLWIFDAGLRQFKESNASNANGEDSCAY